MLATESDASDASDSSDVSDTADTSDVTDTTDPSDASETSDPTDPTSGCADPLAVNQNTPDPCTYDDLSDGVSNAGFEIGCGEDGNRLDSWNTTTTDAEVFIATTGERFITAPGIDDGEARFSAFNGNHAARLSNRNNGERTEAESPRAFTQQHPSAGSSDARHGSVFAVRPARQRRSSSNSIKLP